MRLANLSHDQFTISHWLRRPSGQARQRHGRGKGPAAVVPALLAADELIDAALAGVLGPADGFTRDAIADICNDALADVLGPVMAEQLRADRRLLPLVAPWVWDLARGLQYQSRYGAVPAPTADLLAFLCGRPLPPAQVQQFAETIDLAVVLSLHRVVGQVLGPGACARDPAENEAAAPWLAGLTLGYRIELARELLRLSGLAG